MTPSFKNWYQCQQFDPGVMGWLVNPFFLARRGLMTHLKPLLGNLEGEVLDVGCGRKPYEALVRAKRYLGLDFDSAVTRDLATADLYYGGGRFPLESAQFDGVLCTQVLEHVFTPNEFLSEIARVIKPQGLLVLTVPFVWDEHEQPQDFGRYTSFGLKALLAEHGFETVVQEKSAADGRALAQLMVGYWYKITRSESRFLNAVGQLCWLAPLTLVGWGLSALLPRNPDLYLDNIILARKRS